MLIVQKGEAEKEQASQASFVKQSNQSQSTAAEAPELSEQRAEPVEFAAPAIILDSHASSEALSEGTPSDPCMSLSMSAIMDLKSELNSIHIQQEESAIDARAFSSILLYTRQLSF